MLLKETTVLKASESEMHALIKPYILPNRMKDKKIADVRLELKAMDSSHSRLFCLYDLSLYVPVNNFSVVSGWVFRG